MKPLTYILAVCLVVAAFIGGLLYTRFKPATMPQPLSLEQILSIKELHLVKHVYQDLFFLHKKNDKSKAIRAIVYVPVEITAYLDLKKIKVVYDHDSVKQVVLPHAYLNAPHYRVEQLVIRKTRSFQIHAGKDLYPLVGRYLGDILAERMDTVRNMAVANRILVQAEAEGKEYITGLLIAAGRADVKVTFDNEATDTEVIRFNAEQRKMLRVPSRTHTHAQIEKIAFGFIPIRGND
ncbi:MAG: DUF4230 domain-containing protein [Bacteroidota bacterium]|mgnify:CR=1 FL=1